MMKKQSEVNYAIINDHSEFEMKQFADFLLYSTEANKLSGYYSSQDRINKLYTLFKEQLKKINDNNF